MLSSFIKTYENRQFRHTTMVRHQGTVLAFAMGQDRRIYYTVLDPEHGARDVEGWSAEPQQLQFPNEITKVGYALVGPFAVPTVKVGTRLEVHPSEVTRQETDAFLSTTARLSAEAPFQVVSDNKHVYLFRQAVDSGHEDRLFMTGSDGGRLSGQVRRAGLVFDGRTPGTHVDLGTQNLDFSRGFTVEAWVCYGAFQAWSRIIDLGNGAGINNIYFGNPENRATLVLGVFSGRQGRLLRGPENALLPNVWQHVAASVDASGDGLLYINGRPVTPAPVALYRPRNVRRTNCYMGRSNWGSDAFFRGSIREVRLWTTARSEAEIRDNRDRRLTGDEPDLALYCPLNEGSGRRARDLAADGEYQIRGEANWQDGSDGEPVVDSTLLVDRFVLAESELKPVMEVRFRRSRNKSRPASQKDTLGAQDMDGNFFLEPTSELDFVRGVGHGRFTALLLPTEIADLQRWQIFAHNYHTGAIDSWNVERARDGLFQTQGTLLYTSPDPRYSSAVLERKPGKCPFTGDALVPILQRSGYAEWALELDTGDDFVELPGAGDLGIVDGDFTIEAWFRLDRMPSGHVAPVLFSDNPRSAEDLHLHVLATGEIRTGPGGAIFSKTRIAAGGWRHVALRFTGEPGEMTLFVDGELDSTRRSGRLLTASNSMRIAGGCPGHAFQGAIDEVRIWNRALDDEEISEARHHRLVGNEPGLTAYYRFDEGRGETVHDQTDNALDGMIRGTPRWIESTAPIGDHPGVRRTSFRIAGRSVKTALSSLLYFQQETMRRGDDPSGDREVKQNARVLLAVGTGGPDPFEPPVTDGLIVSLSGESYDRNGTWTDRSDRGNHGRGTASGGPTRHRVVDYRHRDFYVARFRGSDGLELPDQLDLSAGPFTLMVVDRYWGDVQGRTVQSRTTRNWFLGKWAGKDGAYFEGSHVGNRPARKGVFALNTAVVDGTKYAWYLDGVSQAERAGSGLYPGTLGVGAVGTHAEGSEADVACVLAWNRVLTEDQRQVMEAWLGLKYGIDLPHDLEPPKADRNYVAMFDFALSREGKLPQLPDVIALPLLTPTSLDARSRADAWDRVGQLRSEIPRVQDEISALDVEVWNLENRILPMRAEVRKIGQYAERKTRADASMQELMGRGATFFENPGGTGRELRVTLARPYLPDLDPLGFDNIISAVGRVDRGVGVLAWQHPNRGGSKWGFSVAGGQLIALKEDAISSIEISADATLQSEIARAAEEQMTSRNLYNEATTIRDVTLPPLETELAAKASDRGQKNEKLNRLNDELRRLTERLNGEPSDLVPGLLHVDPAGLTLSGALLGFAWTPEAPQLFDSASGSVTLYFRGYQDQFFAAYYDTSTERMTLSLATGGGGEPLRLMARNADPELDDTRVEVRAGSRPDRCTLAISNASIGVTETWADVPREVAALARVLNGQAAQPLGIGTLGASASGTVTRISLREPMARNLERGTVLLIAGRRAVLGKDASAGNPSQRVLGDSTLETESVSLTADEGSVVEFLEYDYQTKAASSRQGDILTNGSLFLRVVPPTPGARVQDGAAAHDGSTRSCMWRAEAPGRCLRFDGSDDYLALDSAELEKLERKGDITVELWARPSDPQTSRTIVRGCFGVNGCYGLSIDPVPSIDSMVFDGRSYLDVGSPENLKIDQSLTVEMWLKPSDVASNLWQNPWHKAYAGEGSMLLRDGRLLFLCGDTGSLGEGHYDLLSTLTTFRPNEWVHVAIVRNMAAGTLSWYVNGRRDSWMQMTRSVRAGNDPMRVGSGYAAGFKGEIDDVRVWSTARSPEQIQENYARRLTGDELYLEGYWRRRAGAAGPIEDQTRQRNHGRLTGSVVSAGCPPPLRRYQVRAQVDDSGIRGRKPLYAFQWRHLAAVFNQSYGLRFARESYLDCGDEEMLNLTEDLSIEAFVSLDTLGTNHGILCKGMPGEDGEHGVPYALHIDAQGSLVFGFEDGDRTWREFRSTRPVGAGFSRIGVTRAVASERHEDSEERPTTVQETVGGTTNTRTTTVRIIKSVELRKWMDIRFYIDGAAAGQSRYDGKFPVGNKGPLSIGRSYRQDRRPAHLQGALGEARIWSLALDPTVVCSRKLHGREKGLVGWWRMEENEGHTASDSKSTNHGRIHGARWIESPDPEGSSFELYVDGERVETEVPPGPVIWSGVAEQFTVGATKGPDSYFENYPGELEEIRIWRTARSQEQIQDNMFGRLKGEKEDLIANYTMDGDYREGVLLDSGIRDARLRAGAGVKRPEQIASTAPVGVDTAQVRSALSGVKTPFQGSIDGRPSVAEYGEMQRLEDGTMVGVYKRCYSFTQGGAWKLITGYKVGNLVQEWIGQAQFDPQVMGFVEGAPPVPSENLTVGPKSSDDDYDGVSTITVRESEQVSYTVSTSRERGFSTAFELAAKVGFSAEVEILQIVAPLGVGIAFPTPAGAKFDFGATLGGSLESSNSWSDGESVGAGRNVSQAFTVGLSGNWEDQAHRVNRDLSGRFVPANMGFALVQSETADVFALRLKHNNALVMLRFMPNPDIPKDWNIIPFPINDRYTKQGTLDGRVGYDRQGAIVLDPAYAPYARGYGEYSYFKPKEAYALKRRIQRQEQELIEYYKSFDTTPAGAQGLGAGAGAAAALGMALGPAGALLASAGASVGGLIEGISGDRSLPERIARRNLVNTYVWTAAGGFFEESTQLSEVRQETTGGSFALSGAVKGGMEISTEIFGATWSLEMNASAGGSLNLTKTKTRESEHSFGLEVSAAPPGDLQQYDDEGNRRYGPAGEVVLQSGKVDAYRFLTFYLEADKDNFDDLFNKVIDPVWLNQSGSPNASALRQARRSSKKPPCWRVFHRVTYISRILPEFPDPTQAPVLEESMSDLGIASNYQLIRQLDPIVRNAANLDFDRFSAAVHDAVRRYLPALEPFQEEILSYMAAYYGLEV